MGGKKQWNKEGRLHLHVDIQVYTFNPRSCTVYTEVGINCPFVEILDFWAWSLLRNQYCQGVTKVL